MLTDIGRGDAMVAVHDDEVAGSAGLNERDLRRWLHGLQVWHAARFVVMVEFLVTIVVSGSAVTRCSAVHPSICGPSTQGDWAFALAILTGLLLLAAPGLGCVTGIGVGVLGAARDPTLGARGWWAAGAALSVGLLVSLLLIRHRQRQVTAARMHPLTPSADGTARTRIRLRDWAVVPGVLAAAGIVAMVLYSHDAANSHRHEQNAQRAMAIVDGRYSGYITVQVLEVTPRDQLLIVDVGVQHAGIYELGEEVPVMVDLTGNGPWVRLVAEPNDPTTWRQVALVCFLLAGAFLVLRARRWWVRRSMATRDLQAISASVRWLEDDVVAVFAADGSGRPVARLRIIAGNEIADREAGGSFPSSGRHDPGDAAYVSGQFWYGGVVRMRSRDRRHVADAMVRLPRWTLVESWVRPTRDFRAEMARRQAPPDALLSDSPASPPRSSTPPHPDVAAGRTTWQPPPDDMSSDSPASAQGTDLAVARVAATAPEPFRIYARHRRTAAWIGWPLCAALLAFPAAAGLIAVFGGRNTAWLSGIAPAFALLGVLWVAPVVFYVRSHVRVEQAGVTLVNEISRYQIPWNAIDRVELRPGDGSEKTVLAVTTPHGVITADGSHGYEETDPRMIQWLELIAEYREQMRLTDPESSATIKVSGAAALLPRWRRLR
jgi:hypothetical protein